MDYAQARYYSYMQGRFTSPDDFINDTNATDPQSWNLYVYVRNNPLVFVDPTGMRATDFINLDSGERTHIDDGIDQVFAGDTAAINHVQETFNNNKSDYLKVLQVGEKSTLYNLHMTTSQFDDLAAVIYAESSNNATWTEAAGIHGVLRNRAAGDGNSVLDQANDTSQVFGANEKGKMSSIHASPAKISAVYQGIAKSGTGKDYSNGAYYWHGVDFKQHTRGSTAHEDFYLTGFQFTSSSHDIWNLGDHKSGNKYKYKFESTAAYRKTTFMKLTQAWMKAKGANTWRGTSR